VIPPLPAADEPPLPALGVLLDEGALDSSVPPVIMYRGMNDEFVPYEDGDTYASAMSDLDQWKTLNSCTGTPQK
jgi:hypothetical protein